MSKKCMEPNNVRYIEDYKSSKNVIGEVHCQHCQHKWTASVFIEDPNRDIEYPLIFECPECKSYKGFFTYPFLPKAGDIIYRCNCGAFVGYMTEEGYVCCECGTVHSNFVDIDD